MEFELESKNLCLSYKKKPAFQDLSLKFPKNKITAIIGPSGCGKSSYISCLNTLYKLEESKLSGDLIWKGRSILDSETETCLFQKGVGTIFQNPSPFPTSIKKNLLLPLNEHFKLSKTQQDLEIKKVLEDVGLWGEVKNKLNESALKLSGGQMQRLCLARALILKPKILLLDEPCSALDPISTATIEKLLLDLKQDITIIMVTHNLAQAKRLADHVALFWHKENCGGYLESYGATSEIFDHSPTPITKSYIQGLSG